MGFICSFKLKSMFECYQFTLLITFLEKSLANWKTQGGEGGNSIKAIFIPNFCKKKLKLSNIYRTPKLCIYIVICQSELKLSLWHALSSQIMLTHIAYSKLNAFNYHIHTYKCLENFKTIFDWDKTFLVCWIQYNVWKSIQHIRIPDVNGSAWHQIEEGKEFSQYLQSISDSPSFSWEPKSAEQRYLFYSRKSCLGNGAT